MIDKLLPWLRLFRVAILPSALSNILAGYLLANGSWTPTSSLMLLLLSTSLLYSAGMVLNDVYDFDQDLEQRPERPLPSGAISVVAAKRTGYGMLLGGIVFACLAGWMAVPNSSAWIRPGCVATALASCVVLYDKVLKKTAFAPLVMGSCRGLNMLLGASTFVAADATTTTWVGFPLIVLAVAGAVTILIAGVTLLGRYEACENAPWSLLPAGLVLAAGIGGLAAVPFFAGQDFSSKASTLYPLLILLVSVTILRRSYVAIESGKPKDIQMAVISVLRSLIIFDACLCYLAAPSEVLYPISVICLLIPSLILSRRVSST